MLIVVVLVAVANTLDIEVSSIDSRRTTTIEVEPTVATIAI